MAHKPPADEMQITPINAEETIIPLVEQLNGLLDRYAAIYGLYCRFQFANNDRSKRLEAVLVEIETAIEALCLRIAKTPVIIKTEGITSV